MKTLGRSLLVLSLLVVTSNIVTAQDPATQPEKLSKYMRAKLTHSQSILEALALEDFQQMGKHAQDLKLLSHESIWNVFQTEQYRLYSTDFRRRTDDLMQAAKNKNLDGASLAYVELTLNCVQCHKYVRDVRQGKQELPKKEPKPEESK